VNLAEDPMTNGNTSDVSNVRDDEHLDWPKLEQWLRERIEGLKGPMRVGQFHGGHANLTYCVSFDDLEFVVRRQPHGEIPPGAHDMARENRVLKALGEVFPFSPRSIAFCENENVVGAPFVVMERRHGIVIRDFIPAPLATMDDVERRVSMALVDAMASLHSIDATVSGLNSLGRPEGFVERQLEDWSKRWRLSNELPNAMFDATYTKLKSTRPESRRIAVVHNDLKLDNCMFASDNPDEVSAIFDWDMATLGDPLIELGTLLSYWREEGDQLPRAPTIKLDMTSFPTRGELIERYSQCGIDMTHIRWYEAFGLWKHAVVLQQLYNRFERGQSKDLRLGELKPNIDITLEIAHGVASTI
jgi:aminoglycoside phosphotransferase (APT) family kinase protein